MTPRPTRALLVVHLTSSIGWFGAVVVFIALAITGLLSQDTQLVRASLIAMERSTWFVILPFGLTSLCTGILQAMVTKWGLFRHYWVVLKLFLTLVSSFLLVLHLKPITDLANAAVQPSFANVHHNAQIFNLVTKAGAAIIVLLTIIILSVYKPWGMVQLKISDDLVNDHISDAKKSLASYALIAIGGLIIVFIVSHLLGSTHGHQ